MIAFTSGPGAPWWENGLWFILIVVSVGGSGFGLFVLGEKFVAWWHDRPGTVARRRRRRDAERAAERVVWDDYRQAEREAAAATDPQVRAAAQQRADHLLHYVLYKPLVSGFTTQAQRIDAVRIVDDQIKAMKERGRHD